MRLGLGTAQFGFDYGISNKKGCVSSLQVAEILLRAQKSGIQFLDTAHLYGKSEQVLGMFDSLLSTFKVVTKTPYFEGAITKKDCNILKDAFNKSLEKLHCHKVYGLLVHKADNLIGEGADYLWQGLEDLKQQGCVEKIGVSVYSSLQLHTILDRFQIDLVQLPINVLDQRFLHDGSLRILKKKGVEIHARSIFLQGLLLLEPTELNPFFDIIRPLLDDYYRHVNKAGLSLLAAALNFVYSLSEIDCVLVGVCSSNQLDEIINVVNNISFGLADYKKFKCDYEQIINPSQWCLT